MAFRLIRKWKRGFASRMEQEGSSSKEEVGRELISSEEKAGSKERVSEQQENVSLQTVWQHFGCAYPITIIIVLTPPKAELGRLT